MRGSARTEPDDRPVPGMRSDEHGIRLLFVEHSPDYARLVCETLDASSQGRFEVRRASRLADLGDDAYDALLLDFTAGSAASAEASIESASRLASRLPVIVLTGSDDEASASAAATDASIAEATLRDRIKRSKLPDAILHAVRRHRRLGQQGASEPIVLRDPLRALAKAFARLCGA